MNSLRYLNKYILRYKLRFALGIVFVGLSVFFSILIPPVIREALNFIIDQTTALPNVESRTSFTDAFGSEVLWFGAKVIGCSLISGFFMYCMRKTIIVMSRLIEYDLRKDIYEHYQVLNLSFYKSSKTGDLMSRISEDVSKVRMYLGPAIMYGIRVTFLFSFIIYSMFQVNQELTMYALLPLPFLSISIYYVSSIINRRSARIQEQTAKINSIAQEVYSGIRIVKSYGKEPEFDKYFDQESNDFKMKSLSLARVQALFFPLMILLVSLSTLLTVYIGGKLVISGAINYGNIVEFVIYISMLTWPITSIGWIASIIQTASASQTRINEILNIEPEITNDVIDTETLKGHIQFDNVSFTYPETGITALKDVSFTIRPGEKIAIVGKTASGKSTIAELLMRFYDVNQGQITFDGKPIIEHDLNNLRSRIGYVPQNVFLFSDSINANINFGNAELDNISVEQFAEIAALKEDIKGFPEQFETVIGERGVTISGGQKQRLSIARALIKKPDIVVLDDCLSAVDANTEHKILSHLNDALRDKTAIIITHRISSLFQFDRIYVLEKGELVQQGTHKDLVEVDGYYRQIVSRQTQ